MKKQVMVAVMTIMLAVIGGFQATQAFAEDTNAENPLVRKLAGKFGLKQDEVQAVFDAVQTERMQQRETQYTTYLTKLVTDGKITEAQKQLLLEKRKEMSADRPDKSAMQSMTPEERRAQMDAKKQEMDTWANENGIDTQYLMGPKGGGGHGRGGMPGAAPAN